MSAEIGPNGHSTRVSQPETVSNIVDRWAKEGPLVRLPTGIEALDRACRGGLPLPWRVFVVGAPSAGKTALQVLIANHLARAPDSTGACVGMLAIDEDPDDLSVRLLQIAGFSVAEAEARDLDTLARMSDALTTLRIRIYDSEHTIESAAADLSAFADGRHAVLCVDSLQTARSSAALATRGPRDYVEANVAAIRAVSTKYRLLVIATSEANRAAYRENNADQNDLAAGAESRAIEFGAQTQLVLRTPKGHPDVVHVRIAKNRRAYLGEFWLRLDRERHALTECAEPSNDPALAKQAEDAKRADELRKIEIDAIELAKIVAEQQGLTTRGLRAAIKAAGLKWGIHRIDAAIARLTRGVHGVRLRNTGNAASSKWLLEAMPILDS